MKRKFYDDPPKLEMVGPCCWANKDQYTSEINWIAKHMSLDVNKFRVDDITFGEPVLFYRGEYMGYLDNLFYRAFDIDDFQDWWGFDN